MAAITSSIEIQVSDLANLAQLLGRVFEEISPSDASESSNMIMTAQTYNMLSFLVGELCGRSIRLEQETDQAFSEPSEKLAA